jgi:type II secretory pathway pseudopilin PulG
MDCSVTARPKGVTLLELIFALFLFATLVPLFVGLWSSHHRAVKKNAEVIVGNNICQLILEQAIAAGYSGVDAVAATPLADRTLSLRTTITDSSKTPSSTWSQDKSYIWTMTVTDSSTDSSLMADEKLVTVEVAWEMGERTETTTAATLLVNTP